VNLYYNNILQIIQTKLVRKYLNELCKIYITNIFDDLIENFICGYDLSQTQLALPNFPSTDLTYGLVKNDESVLSSIAYDAKHITEMNLRHAGGYMTLMNIASQRLTLDVNSSLLVNEAYMSPSLQAFGDGYRIIAFAHIAPAAMVYCMCSISYCISKTYRYYI
jgi:hypothetical protein